MTNTIEQARNLFQKLYRRLCCREDDSSEEQTRAASCISYTVATRRRVLILTPNAQRSARMGTQRWYRTHYALHVWVFGPISLMYCMSFLRLSRIDTLPVVRTYCEECEDMNRKNGLIECLGGDSVLTSMKISTYYCKPSIAKYTTCAAR